jgi:hypothetical protein
LPVAVSIVVASIVAVRPVAIVLSVFIVETPDPEFADIDLTRQRADRFNVSGRRSWRIAGSAVCSPCRRNHIKTWLTY